MTMNPAPAAPAIEGEEIREFRKQLAFACNDPGHFVGFKGDRSLGEWQADALLRGPLAQLRSDLQAARDERDEIRNELSVERLMRISAQASAEHWERRYEDLCNGPNG